MLHFFLVKLYAASLHGVSPFDCEKVLMDQNLQDPSSWWRRRWKASMPNSYGPPMNESCCKTCILHIWKSTATGGKNFAAACNWQGTCHSPLFILKKSPIKFEGIEKARRRISDRLPIKGAGIVQIFQSDSGAHSHSTARGQGNLYTEARLMNDDDWGLEVEGNEPLLRMET